MDHNQRLIQAVRGLVRGDSMNWAAAKQRLNLVPPKRRRRMRILDEFAEQRSQSTLPVPYLHSTHESVFDPLGPADVAEWFTVSLLSSAALTKELKKTDKQSLWIELTKQRQSDPSTVRGRVGTTIALATLAENGNDGTSGKDNPHYFDDMGLVRAAAVAMQCRDPESLEREITDEVSLTASGDGLLASVAFGTLFYELLGGSTKEAAINAAIDRLPAGTWGATVLKQSLDIAANASSIDDLTFALERDIADHVYCFPVAAPETLAMICAHLAFATSRDQLIAAGILHSSRVETMAPLLWGIAGVLFGGYDQKSRSLQGVSVLALRGTNSEDVITELVTQSKRNAS
jgi:hypothetical protein